jgi:hypothetical protein
MNTSPRALLILALLAAASTASASDETAARHRVGSQASQSTLVRGSEDKDTHEVSEMKDSRKSMQELMAKIEATTDAAERRALLQQHSQAMQAHLETIRAALSTGPLKAKALRERTDMMQAMLDQMQAHQKIADEMSAQPGLSKR